MADKTFIPLRYYIIKSKQKRLFKSKYDDTPDGKKKLFIDAFLQNESNYITNRGTEYILLDLENQDQLYFGNFCKKGEVKIPKKEGGHLKKRPTVEYPYSYFVCDTDNHIFCIEKKSKVFREIDDFLSILSNMVTQKIKDEGFVCKFETIDERHAFWDIIESAHSIYSLELNLNSPNLLDANKKARESLKGVHSLFNNTSATVRLENEEGDLIIEKTAVTESYIEYAEEGGGNWSLKTDMGDTKSSDKALSIKCTFKNIETAAKTIISSVSDIFDK
ncbi:hypothetical protein [Methanococcoides sp. AM1]|uniref:hypothetical protein n=1 Tax=Methanococcoides sp. AM1 TaxID=1201011 RepID=UPI0010830D35|nr:hypothetical protein [Methanococcoides sp. AM1]